MSRNQRKPVVAVIGQAGPLPAEIERMAHSVGRRLVDAGFRLATGGLDGVMAAVSQGARSSPGWHDGDIIGIVPSYDANDANPWVDIVVTTGLGVARNIVLVASADAVLSVAGGSGTLSELAAAWQLGRPIVALASTGGWSAELAGRALDDRRRPPIVLAQDPEEAVAQIRRILRAKG